MTNLNPLKRAHSLSDLDAYAARGAKPTIFKQMGSAGSSSSERASGSSESPDLCSHDPKQPQAHDNVHNASGLQGAFKGQEQASHVKPAQSGAGNTPPPLSKDAEQGVEAAQDHGQAEETKQPEAGATKNPQAGTHKEYVPGEFFKVPMNVDGRGDFVHVKSKSDGVYEVKIQDPASKESVVYQITITPAGRIPEGKAGLQEVGALVGPMIHAALTAEPGFKSMTCSAPNGKQNPQVELMDKDSRTKRNNIRVPPQLAQFLAGEKVALEALMAKHDAEGHKHGRV